MATDLITKWPKIEHRCTGLQKWLKRNHPEVFTEQKHQDEGSMARAYWHYGYAIACRDIIRALTGKECD